MPLSVVRPGPASEASVWLGLKKAIVPALLTVGPPATVSEPLSLNTAPALTLMIGLANVPLLPRFRLPPLTSVEPVNVLTLFNVTVPFCVLVKLVGPCSSRRSCRR